MTNIHEPLPSPCLRSDPSLGAITRGRSTAYRLPTQNIVKCTVTSCTASALDTNDAGWTFSPYVAICPDHKPVLSVSLVPAV